VRSYRLEYLTTDADGRAIRASGLVSVPVKASGSISPILSYQHGTIYRDAEAPSNHAIATEVAVMLAASGYIVVAPDYVGYGVSKGASHPFLLAAPSAAVSLDLLTAAKTWQALNGVRDNGQLFMVGYSEGAYVTMAAYRAMQTSDPARLATLRAVVTGDGAYNVEATLDAIVNQIKVEQPALGALLQPGVLRFLGTTVRRQLSDSVLAHVLPANADVSFSNRFIDNYLADATEVIAQVSSVYDWRPTGPLRLFHGRNDRTVPYLSSTSTLQAMQGRGAPDVSLVDCAAVPSDHLPCVPLFMNYMLGQLAARAQNL